MDKKQLILNTRVDDINSDERIDSWLTKQLTGYSRSQIKQFINQNYILINQKTCKVGQRLKLGDHILVYRLPSQHTKVNPRPLDLNIVFEDDQVIVINKPAGIVVHPGAGTTETTLVEGLLHHGKMLYNDLSSDETALRPGIVHRLDKDTTGLLVFAKTKEAYQHLSKQLRERTSINREYLALQEGAMHIKERIVESYLYRNPKRRTSYSSIPIEEYERMKKENSDELPKDGRWAKSIFNRIALFGHQYSLVSIKLVTGRTHQIRVHSQEIGLPIVGDPVYNRKKTVPSTFPKDLHQALASIDGQLLHARKLGFIHPTTGKKMNFESQTPQTFQKILNLLRPYDSLS